MKESERLIAAKALIDAPEKWMQGLYCNNGLEMSGATCFCSVGAVHMVRNGDYLENDDNSTTEYLQRALNIICPQSLGIVSVFNDNNTHEAVMEMFDLAIKLAQDEGN